MAFVEGLLWATSSGDWNRQRTGSNSSSNFAYGEDLLEVSSGTLNYYLNGAPIYTSTMTPTDLYPYINSYQTGSDVTINADYTTTKSITFTINDYATVNVPNSGWGLNDNTNLDGWQGLNASFSLDDGKYWVYEAGQKTTPQSFTPVDGDTWTLAWETAPVTARIFTYV